MKPSRVVAVLTVASLTVAWGCSRTNERLGVELGPQTEQFGGADAGADVAPDPRELIAYCPSNKCPPGWTTCPNSRFACDVNLRLDVNNCGVCGFACPNGAGSETFSCNDGACVMQCSVALKSLDCDGFPDNGCETTLPNDNHCGVCGNKCSDPAKPCVFQGGPGSDNVACGCPAGKRPCGSYCVDDKTDDFNCGSCSNYCDPSGNGAPSIPGGYYGCVNGTCGGAKCKGQFADCDNDPANGCETSLVSDANCGGCGVACGGGQKCRLDPESGPRCMCPAPQTLCELGCEDGICSGQCVDVTSDVANCGRCGSGCGYIPGATRTCDYGACVMRCSEGRADCNNSPSDGCEVDTASDPRNCGACGHTCEAAGQACVAGVCVVEPCNVLDAGEVAR
jgi:hypothetical protein